MPLHILLHTYVIYSHTLCTLTHTHTHITYTYICTMHIHMHFVWFLFSQSRQHSWIWVGPRSVCLEYVHEWLLAELLNAGATWENYLMLIANDCQVIDKKFWLEHRCWNMFPCRAGCLKYPSYACRGTQPATQEACTQGPQAAFRQSNF